MNHAMTSESSGLNQVVSSLLIIILGVSAMAIALKTGVPVISARMDMKRYRDGLSIAASVQACLEELIACGQGCSRSLRLSLPEGCFLTFTNDTLQLRVRVSKPRPGSATIREKPHTTLAWYSMFDSYIFNVTLKEYPSGCRWHFNTTEMILGRELTLTFTLQGNYTIMVTGG